jgi:bifunctional NMN adenylyltransferase/nudix hydrolase
VLPLRDFKYNDQKWIVNVQKIVLNTMYERLGSIGNDSAKVKIAVIGLNKDDSTNYLTWFPTWTYLETKPVEQEGLDATSIRDLLFGGKPLSFAQGVVPPTTYEFLVAAKNLPWWKNLEDEFEFVKAYKKSWEAAPYPPTFVTVDAVVVQDGHVLMVKRGANPGKGLLALPGGFVNQNERLEDAVIRELREETRLKVPEPVLKGSVVTRDVFDAPDRSLRGRTITHATLFVLKSVGSLPVVKGGDDAEKAMWIPIANLNESEIFEDHHAIIQTMIDKI